MRPLSGILAVVVVGLALPASAVAQEAPVDTVGPEIRPAEPIPVDTLTFLDITPADTIPVLGPRFRERGGPEELAAVPSEDLQPKNPRNAAIRAFLIPGWGQLYTGHPLRAVAFATAEVGFFALGYRKQQEVLDQRDDIDAAREAYFTDPPEGAPTDSLELEEAFQRTEEFLILSAELEDLQERRNDWYAYAVASVIFAAVDAYTAAQLDPIEIGAEPAEGRVWGAVRVPVGRVPDRGGGP